MNIEEIDQLQEEIQKRIERELLEYMTSSEIFIDQTADTHQTVKVAGQIRSQEEFLDQVDLLKQAQDKLKTLKTELKNLSKQSEEKVKQIQREANRRKNNINIFMVGNQLNPQQFKSSTKSEILYQKKQEDNQRSTKVITSHNKHDEQIKEFEEKLKAEIKDGN